MTDEEVEELRARARAMLPQGSLTPGSNQPTYVQHVLDAIAEEIPGLHPDLARLYALLALVTGTGTTLEHVHDAWALWRTMTRPDHPSIVPFAELTVEVQELDRPYTEAIHRVARAITPTEAQ